MDNSESGESLKVGLALGSGGAKGWSHIGIIRALECMGIRPTIITGASIGALVGAAYANDSLDRLEKWVRPMTWTDVLSYFDISLSGSGLIQGGKLLDAIQHETFGNVNIEDMPKAFGAVATQLRSGQEVWFREGDLFNAIRASIALPGLFTPVRHKGKWLIDGGLVNPVPVSLCRSMGAEIVIAVNLNSEVPHRSRSKNDRALPEPSMSDEEHNLWDRISKQLHSGIQDGRDALAAKFSRQNKDIPGMYEVFSNTINIMQNRIARSRMSGDPPDVILTPRVSEIVTLDFHKAEIAIEAGEACAYRMRPVLEELFMYR